MRPTVASFLPIAALASAMAVVYLLVDPSVYYDPPWLIVAGNTVFIGGVSFAISLIALRNYNAGGRAQILLLGCGVLTFGFGGVLAAALRNVPGGANVNVTIYNAGALAGGVFHFVAALFLLAGFSPELKRRKLWAAAGYSGAVLFMTAIVAAALEQVTPLFFVQGSGPTLVRQAVLGSAALLFTFSFLVFMGTYLRAREVFLYWYSCALALTVISLTAFFIQSSVGSPVGWVGRLAQYVGGGYFLISLLAASRSARERATSLDSVLNASLSGVEEKFRALAENSPDAIRRFDRQLRHVYVNPAGLQLLGRPLAGVIGKTLDEAGMPPEQCRLWHDRIEGVFETGRKIDVEDDVPAKDGSRFIQSLCVPEYDPDARVVNVLVVSRDLTDHRQAEEALRESRVRMEAALSSMTDAVFISDIQGGFVEFNEAFATFHRFPNKNECARTLREHPDILDVCLPDGTPAPLEMWPVPRALRGETATNAEYRLRRKDTGQTWVGSYSFGPLRDASGTTAGSVVVGRDITEIKQAQEALRESEERFRTMANNIPQLCWMADADGRRFWYNERWYQYTGTTPEQVEGWGWEALHDPEVLPKVLERWNASLATGEPLDMIFRLRGADGTFRPFLTRVMPVRDAEGKTTRWFGTSTDISEQREIEEALRRSNHDLEQFAYAASHDLQEPLRMISIYTEMLARKYRGQPDPETARFIEWILAGARRMHALLDGLLEYSRASRGDVEDIRPIDSLGALTAAMRNLDRAIADSGAAITCDPLPRVRIPEVHLIQLFQNLIANAIRYRSSRPLHVHISASANTGWLQFAVRDNGVGIDPKFFDYIFRVFKRLGAEQDGGTGVGLAICKRIVERWGGRIWVESTPGEGATFCFRLPGDPD